MPAEEKSALVQEIELKIQSLNLLLSTIKTDRSRKPEAIRDFRQQYEEMLKTESRKRKK